MEFHRADLPDNLVFDTVYLANLSNLDSKIGLVPDQHPLKKNGRNRVMRTRDVDMMVCHFAVMNWYNSMRL
jgi:hypothetical protein